MGNIKQIIESVTSMKNIINFFMEFDYIIIFMMFFSFFDMYFSINYGVSFVTALDEWNKYLINPKDYIYSIMILSFVFSIIFPSLRGFYRFLAVVLLDFNISLFEKNDHRLTPVSHLKRKAILENNSIMYSFCLERELEYRKQYIAYSALWAIIVFMLIQSVISDTSPLLLTLFKHIYIYLDSGNWILKLLWWILILSIGTTLLTFLGSSFFIRENNVYLPIDKDNQ